MPSQRVVDVLIDARTGGPEALYTYSAPKGVGPGAAVLAPLGNRKVLGFVIAERSATEEDLGFPFSALRAIESTVDDIHLPPAAMDLVRFVAEETLCPLSVAIGPAVPPGVQDRLVDSWSLAADPDQKLSPAADELVRTLRDHGGEITATRGKPLEAGTLRILRTLVKQGVVRHGMRLAPIQERGDQAQTYRLTSDSAAVERFLAKEGKRKPAQALTLMTLQGEAETRLTTSEIRAMAGVTEATIRALLNAGLLTESESGDREIAKPPALNEAQRVAVEAIAAAIEERRAETFLLFGVTGSGKTEVFLRSATEALAAGRQILYLVPEIALASQAISQLRARFGDKVAVLHSELTPVERLKNWLSIQKGESSIVLGPRSALFAPLDNLGLIVVDEEHEAAYKQETSPRYHARRLAERLSQSHRCPLVLGSATPSVETFVGAEAREAGTGEGAVLLSLPYRAARATMPEVEIEDLGSGYRNGQPTIFTARLEELLRETFAAGNQAILFLNRRAYAPFLICRECGHRFECPRCSVTLSFHKRIGRLRCHHCDFAQVPPEKCPACDSVKIGAFGIGTERVEQALQEMVPDRRIGRLDRDVAQKKGALAETLAAFRAGDLDALVGTQMVAKGLDFPNVTLVGVIAADTSLNLPDFRSAERTYQLLAQVSGRAGRGVKPGRVVIQTFNPEHPAVLFASRHDYLGMFESLRSERREAAYPPFVRLVNVTFSGKAKPAVEAASGVIAKRLSVGKIDFLGPADCVLERVREQWRRHLLIKLPPNVSPASLKDALEEELPKGVTMVVDVDPYSMM